MNEMTVFFLGRSGYFGWFGVGVYLWAGDWLWQQELRSRKVKGLPASSLGRNPEWDEAMDRGAESMWLIVGVWVLAALAISFV